MSFSVIGKRADRHGNGSLHVFALILASVWFFSCATVQAPPGGPEDKSPPRIISVWPPRDSTEVPLDATIVIRFDEYIVASKKSIALLPPVEGVEVKFRGKRIIVKHKEPFSPNTTYRVSLSSKIADLRHNRLKSAQGFAFSTGNRLDTLVIRGRVFEGDLSPSVGARVHAYLLDSENLPTSLPEQPYAVSWTGEDGRFVLGNLPEGRFFLLAFHDANGNGSPDVGEGVAVAPEPIFSGGDAPWSMVESTMDTSAPMLLLAVAENRYILRFKFSEAMASPAEASMKSSPELGRSRLVLDEKSPKNILLFARDGLPEGRLDVALIGLKDIAGNRFGDSLQQVTIPAFEGDTAEPKISYSKDAILPSQPLAVSLNRPIVDGEIVVVDSAGHSVAGTTSVDPPYRLLFKPEPIWPSRRDLVWRLRSATLADGTAFSDSTERRVNIYTASDLGSIEIKHDLACRDAIASGRSIDGKGSDIITFARSGATFVAEVPAGRYLVWLFCDRNGDSLWNAGTIVPLKPSEPIFLNEDTVKVRGLWSVELNF